MIRESPLSGLRRPMSGVRALNEKFQLPRKNGAMSAATISARIRGPTASSASSEISENRASMDWGSRRVCPSKVRPRLTMADVRCIIQPPIIQNAPAATIKTRKAPISRERGTCPSLAGLLQPSRGGGFCSFEIAFFGHPQRPMG